MANDKRRPTPQLDPLWYKDAVIYELHVRAFADSANDGIGDFRGLAEKLDYLQDLGVTAIWLLPFYPSPLRDDGYDIADYKDVNPAYGSLRDFKYFLREAHERGLQVITELVLNHTSDQHPWFQRARRSPAGSAARDFYVWSDTSDKYKETRIIFKDFEHSNWAWDPIANAYFWHRFYSHQPDLNYDNPRVREAMFEVLDFWLEMGVDGLRLDAVPYLYEREGTNCENLPETYEELKRFRRHIDQNFASKMLLAEANQWPEDAVAYFGNGDACHMAFHFPVMPRMFMAMRMEDRYPIIDILAQTPKIPDNTQWALFLRNHDELTLEMVTDEERDYMYRSYAADPQARINLGIRRRLAPLLGNDRRKIELMNGLLFSLPGTPVIYYGDEIGMGDNVYLGDRNGVRTPMQWNSDRNAGFSRANSQRLYLPVIIDPDFHYESLNVEAQQNNPNSLLWWMKRIIALRKRYKAFGRGTIEFLFPENRRVLAYVRRYENENILVVANLSRQAQYVELDLSSYKGWVPTEMFGQTEFPPIGELTYLLTLGPHAFYWFTLEQRRVAVAERKGDSAPDMVPVFEVEEQWQEIFAGLTRARFEEFVPSYLTSRRWFGGKARKIKSVELLDAITFDESKAEAAFAIVNVEYHEGDPETYALALSHASGKRMDSILKDESRHIVLRTRDASGREGVVYESIRDREFGVALLETMARRRRLRGLAGEADGMATRTLRIPAQLEPVPMRAEQSNTSIMFGDRFILKLFRKLDQGTNPDLEVGSVLTQKRRFPYSPPVLGALEYRRNGSEPQTLGILHSYVPNEGDAWQYTLDNLDRYYEQAVARIQQNNQVSLTCANMLENVGSDIPPAIREMIGAYIESARLLGERTAQMHLALAAELEDPAFVPESFTTLYQRSIYQSMRNLTGRTFQTLRSRLKALPDDVRGQASEVLKREEDIQRRFRRLLERKVNAARIRTHGDFHLGQVLYTGKDFIIIDFEGEPARAISERRIKRSPLRDVAGMIRSFHYAAYSSFFAQQTKGIIRSEEVGKLEPWARCWYAWVASTFLTSYLKTAAGADFIPREKAELAILLDAYLLEKVVYELSYELNNRPDWVKLPLYGLAQLLETPTF